MAEVAAEAHVSVKTVSRVVNHQAGVRPDTAERVRAVIQRIGFRRGGGVAIREGRTFTIGLVLEDLGNPFYSQVSAGVEREARMRQYLLVTASAENSPNRERAVLQALVARRVDGVVVVPAGETPEADPAIESAGVPIVHLDRPVRGSRRDTVLSDNLGGMRSAVEHLVAHGHRRIGFLGDDPEFWTARQRRESFLATHTSIGLPEPAPVVMGPHSAETVGRSLQRWAADAEPVTAVITGNNRVTVLALDAMRRAERRPALVAYDDFELAAVVDPPVTAVHQDPVAMGEKAAQVLFARLLGDESPPRTIVLPTRLVVRGSGRRH
ncbi:LacI family DNA-binding transcriptional regulator [Phycicoccus sp. CSK15P-2]|uniref:LacI family DNA-binding transcriptional regulator n=1 Tax=Phycicoccus sp. CSK15P-2 TaxID=2807627 RepID=UPI001950376B|nr:LacI family DNA-binding transcriptional regulator [Phycicoccus sp. CSK15P-2]MBM6402995.1 LacI family DNA-binding transcriptional regulator [Phycicoccus sp. CSK15P-2]